MHRVFFGQLPKNRAMEVLDWLLHLLKPSVPIFHIEAHTAKGGHGKGCAWVYVRTEAEAQELITFHGRALVKVSLATGQLGAYAGEQLALEQRMQRTVRLTCLANCWWPSSHRVNEENWVLHSATPRRCLTMNTVHGAMTPMGLAQFRTPSA